MRSSVALALAFTVACNGHAGGVGGRGAAAARGAERHAGGRELRTASADAGPSTIVNGAAVSQVECVAAAPGEERAAGVVRTAGLLRFGGRAAGGGSASCHSAGVQ